MQYWKGIKLVVVSALWKSKRKSEEKETRTRSSPGKGRNCTRTNRRSSSTVSTTTTPAPNRSSSTTTERGRKDQERYSRILSEAGGRKAGEICEEAEGVSVLSDELKEQEQPIIQIVASASSLVAVSSVCAPKTPNNVSEQQEPSKATPPSSFLTSRLLTTTNSLDSAHPGSQRRGKSTPNPHTSSNSNSSTISNGSYNRVGIWQDLNTGKKEECFYSSHISTNTSGSNSNSIIGATACETPTKQTVSSRKRLKETKLSLLEDLKRPWKKFSAPSISTTNTTTRASSSRERSTSAVDWTSTRTNTSTTSPTHSLVEAFNRDCHNNNNNFLASATKTHSGGIIVAPVPIARSNSNININTYTTLSTTNNKRWNISRGTYTQSATKMDHEELITELPQIEKLTNQERLRLAHKRRMLQLKKFSQYEKDWTSKKNKMLQNELKKNKKNSPRIRFKNSIMLLEAAGRNDVEEVRKLLESGLDPDVANEDGLTALHQCCIDDNEEMMKVLLDYGANVNSEDSEKWTPLHAAATCGHLHLVKYLIAKKANLLAVNAEGNMPYDICDEEGTLDYIESEMAKRGVTQELIEEIRARPETRMLQDMQIIQGEGGDLEYRDADSATPLHIASANGYIRVVEFLLDNHVATDVQDKDYWQPIHAAACWGHVDVLELLVQNGADLNARTKNNETPYAICEDPEIKERIIQLRSEQETKLQDAARRKIRRSQSSNSRTQSIRRTSQRDKGLTSKRDVADEAQMLMAREINIKDNSPSPTHETMSEKSNGLNHNSNPITNHTNHESSSGEDSDEKFKSAPFALGKDSISELKLRKEEMERLSAIAVKSGAAFPSSANNNKHANNANNKQYSNPIAIPVTDSNANLPKPEVNPPVDSKVQIANGLPLSGSSDSLGGNSTIDIHVSVTINTNSASNGVTNGLNSTSSKDSMSNLSYTPPGTLADLKKQRSLRHGRQHANALINGIVNERTTKYEAPASPTISLRRFAGDPGEIVGDYSDGGKKCCVIV